MDVEKKTSITYVDIAAIVDPEFLHFDGVAITGSIPCKTGTRAPLDGTIELWSKDQSRALWLRFANGQLVQAERKNDRGVVLWKGQAFYDIDGNYLGFQYWETNQ